MGKRVLVIDGHPDPAGTHLGNALAATYAGAARHAGHDIRRVTVATLDFPLLRSQAELERGALPASIGGVQEAIVWSDHIAIFYPLWNGGMPALLNGFFEHVFREGFSMSAGPPHGVLSVLDTLFNWDIPGVKGLLKGRSARIVTTMRMPAMVYRMFSLKGPERFLVLAGISPIRTTPLGGVARADGQRRARWFAQIARLGRTAV